MRALAASLTLALAPISVCFSAAFTNEAIGHLIDSARMWETKNRADLARFALEKALLIEPGNPRALRELGIIEIKSNRMRRASELLQQLQAAHPDDPSTRAMEDAYRIATTDRMAMATARFLSNSKGTAEDAVKTLHALFPKGPPGGELGIEYYHILSTTEKGRPEARAGLERLIRESPTDPRPRLELADFFIDQPETRLKGIQLVTELARRDDIRRDDVLKVWRRGLRKLDVDPAHELLFRAFLSVNPDDDEIRQRYTEVSDPLLKVRRTATAHLSAGRFELAERQFREVLKTHPDDLESLEALGKIRLGQERFEEARHYFALVAKLDPGNAGKWDDRIRAARYWRLLRSAKASQQHGQLHEAERLALNALRLKPKDPEARLILAAISAERRDFPLAEHYFRQVLRIEPANERAVQGMIRMFMQRGTRQAAIDLIDSFAQSHPKKAPGLAHQRASLVREEADALLQEGKTGKAMALLENGVKAAPADPWLRYDLARLYGKLGFIPAGRAVMEDVPDPSRDPQGYYAKALFLAGIDDEMGALAALEQIPGQLHGESIDSLIHKTSFRLNKRRAKELLAKGRRPEARHFLKEAERLAANDPDLLWEVAAVWMEAGDVDRALSLWRHVMRAQSPNIPLETELRYADLLNDAKRDGELVDLLDRLQHAGAMNQAETRTLHSIQRSFAIRRAEAMREAGATQESQELLEAALEIQPNEPRLLRALGEFHTEAGNTAEAQRYYDRILAANPLDFDAHLSKAKLTRLTGDHEQAYRMLSALRVSVPREDLDTRLGIIRQLIALEKLDEAREEVTQIRVKHPTDAKVLMQAARIEKQSFHYEQALDLFRQAQVAEEHAPAPSRISTAPGVLRYLSPGTREIQEIENRRYGYVSAGFDYRELSGTQGISAVTNEEYPMLFRYPVGYDGHLFAQVDYATVSAGKLQLGDFEKAREFGKIDALGSPKLVGTLDQSAMGGAFGVGYQTDNWRFDVGSSPQGYPVSYPVGGIRHSGSWGDVYYSWDIARRPVANSKLSYAGAHDPITGEVWGGVRADGGDIYVGYDYGRLGVFAQGAAHYFSGKNVRSNNDIMLRGGADWNFIQEPDMRLNAGFALMYWSYAENQRFYTFGYGGYFSPQDYKSISLPVQWTGRFGDLSYLLRAYGAYSQSSDDGGVYYPTDRNLQALAEQRAGTTVDGFVFPQPFHERSSGGAVSYGVRGAFEYQVDPHWFLGGLLELQRSPFYTPNYMTFYFRYAFEPRTESIPFAPTPLRPYYRY